MFLYLLRLNKFKIKTILFAREKIQPCFIGPTSPLISLAYLCDIFEQLSKLNLQKQGKNTNVIKFVGALKDFKAKLANWKRKAEIYNFAMFKKVDMFLDSREESNIPKVVEKDIVNHFSNL